MLQPGADAIAEAACLRQGTDLTGYVEQINPHIRKGREHDVPMKPVHGLTTTQYFRCAGIFPQDVLAAQRRHGIGIVRIHGSLQAFQKAARERGINLMCHQKTFPPGVTKAAFALRSRRTTSSTRSGAAHSPSCSNNHLIHRTSQRLGHRWPAPESHDQIRALWPDPEKSGELRTNRGDLDRLVEEGVANTQRGGL